MKTKFSNSPLASWIKTFISAMLSQYIALGKSMFDIDAEGWKSILGSGIAATVLVIYNYLNPKDPRYGVNKQTEIVDKKENQ